MHIRPVTGHVQAVQAAEAVGVHARVPATLHRVPAQARAQGVADLGAGNDALVAQQHGGRDFVLHALPAVDDLFQPLRAQGADVARVADDGHSALEDFPGHAQALAQIGQVQQSRGHERAGEDAPSHSAGVQPGRDVHARVQQMPGQQKQQGAVPGQNHGRVPVRREAAARTQQNVRAARAHDAGQGPAGEGHGPLHAAGGQNHGGGFQAARFIVHAEGKAAAFHSPDHGPGQIARAALAEFLHQTQARLAFPGVHESLGQGAFHIAQQLPARRGLLVQQGHFQAAGARRAGRRKTGRARAHDNDVRVLVHYLSSTGGVCRFTTMPSRTGTRQDWTLASPSISMRHSKQTPIRQ